MYEIAFRLEGQAYLWADDPDDGPGAEFFCDAYMFEGDLCQSPLDALASEMLRDQPGQQTMLDRLLDVALVQIVREHFATTGWLPVAGGGGANAPVDRPGGKMTFDIEATKGNWMLPATNPGGERTTETDAPADRAPATTEGPNFGIYIAFVPWVLFTLITQHDTLKAAAVVALLASAAIALPSVLAGRPKLLELGAVLAFVGFTIVAFAADASATAWLDRYARAIAASLLALIAFGSLLMTPFTEQYARESVPRQFWSSPRFRAINRQLTLMWALVFTAMVPSHIIAGAIDTRRGNTIFNWVIPVALIVWAAKRTSAVREASAGDQPATR